MADIIKTWPAFMEGEKVARIFSPDIPPFARYYFTLGRGKPAQPIERVWFTYQGRIIGHFIIEKIVINDGSLPKLRSLENEESDWQIKPDRWVLVCKPPCIRLSDRLYMAGFRGWHYFNLDEYRSTPEAKVRL